MKITNELLIEMGFVANLDVVPHTPLIYPHQFGDKVALPFGTNSDQAKADQFVEDWKSYQAKATSPNQRLSVQTEAMLAEGRLPTLADIVKRIYDAGQRAGRQKLQTEIHSLLGTHR